MSGGRFAGGLGCADGDGETSHTEETIIVVTACAMPFLMVGFIVWLIWQGAVTP